MMSNVDATLSPEDYAQLCKLRIHAREAEDNYLEAAEEAKRAKKAMEGAQLRVNKFLDEMADGPLPLEQQADRNRGAEDADAFNAAALFDAEHADEPIGVGEEPGEFAVVPESELWKSVPIDEIFVPPAVIKKLKAAGISTIGDLADWTTADRDLTDIAGIGEETKNAITDAMIDYFKVNPLPKPQVVEMPSEASESDAQEPGGENVPPSPESGVAGLPGAFPDPPAGKRRRKTKAEPENGADPGSDEAE